MGTVTPPSFQCQDVVATLSTEHLTLGAEQDGRGSRPPFVCVVSEFGGCVLPAMCADEHHQRREAPGPTQTLTGKSVLSSVLSETGSFESANGADGQSWAPNGAFVCVERLQLGRQGPVAQLPLDGFTDVRVDRYDSLVHNPFTGGCSLTLCRAYDELVRMVLTTPMAIDDCLDEYNDSVLQLARRRPHRASSFELELLRTVANRHGVRVRASARSPMALRPWLVHHAKRLLEGTSFRLLDDHAQGGTHVPPWTCHAQSLQGALLWVAITHQGELLESCPGLVERDSSFSQVGHRYPSPFLSFFTCGLSACLGTLTLGLLLPRALPHSPF